VRLITAHRILILAAIAFFCFYAFVLARQYLVHGGAAPLMWGALSCVVAGGLVAYYRTLKGWGTRL
jgi:hypothetical protein